MTTNKCMKSSGPCNDQKLEEVTREAKRVRYIDDIDSSFFGVKKDEPQGLYYGLPLHVKDHLLQVRNITCLYDWQDEILTLMVHKMEVFEKTVKSFNNSENIKIERPDEFFKTNLLYLAPTSGGKTLVAEILIFFCLLRLKKNCIFVMPFVSIVQEKVNLMEPFAKRFFFNIVELSGNKG